MASSEPTSSSGHRLMVQGAFGDHRRGDIIANSAEVQAVYDAGLEHHCVAIPAAPEPTTQPPEADEPQGQTETEEA